MLFLKLLNNNYALLKQLLFASVYYITAWKVVTMWHKYFEYT